MSRSTVLYGDQARRARIRELDPGRCVIAGLFPSAHIAVDACRFKSLRYRRTEQDMVDAQSCVAAVGVPEIIPEGIDTLVRMECSQRVGPALGDEASIGVADFRSEQRVVYPSLRLVDVEIGGHDVVVAGKHDGPAAGEKCFGMGGEPVKPSQLEIELRTGRRGLPFGR